MERRCTRRWWRRKMAGSEVSQRAVRKTRERCRRDRGRCTQVHADARRCTQVHAGARRRERTGMAERPVAAFRCGIAIHVRVELHVLEVATEVEHRAEQDSEEDDEDEDDWDQHSDSGARAGRDCRNVDRLRRGRRGSLGARCAFVPRVAEAARRAQVSVVLAEAVVGVRRRAGLRAHLVAVRPCAME